MKALISTLVLLLKKWPDRTEWKKHLGIARLSLKQRLLQARETLNDLRSLKGTNESPFRSNVMDFLPAALEVQQRPPSPVGRYLMWTLLLLFSLGVGWMLVGKVDIVAVAPGKIIPGGKSKTIQSLVTATVSEIHVQDGQAVRAGDPLITLDSESVQARQQQLQSELDHARAGQWRSELLLAAIDSIELGVSSSDEESHVEAHNKDQSITVGLPLNSPIARSTIAGLAEPAMAAAKDAQIPQSLQRSTRELANRQLDALNSELLALSSTRLERQAEKQAAISEQNKWRLQLPLVARRAESHKKLAAANHVSQDNRDVVEQQRIDVEQNLAMAINREQQLSAAIDSIEASQQRLLSVSQSNWQQEHYEYTAQIAQLEQELVKVNSSLKSHMLTAPVDGTVQQLGMHTVGGVVTPAEPLMMIVPKETVLEVEASLANKDIGFVRAGQSAKVKVDAFPFTRYGAVEGAIQSISADAVEIPNIGWVYDARVSLDRAALKIEGKEVGLSAGMSVMVEIKTGKRRMIEYVLSPLLRYRDESVRER
jgi:hemolysin D